MRARKPIKPLLACRDKWLWTRLLLAGAVLLATPARSHDFWIEPDVLMPREGQEVNVRLREGMAFKGNTLPYINDWFRDFSLVTAAGREQVFSLQGNDPAATLEIGPGATLLGYLSNRNLTELDAEKFNGYLEDEGIAFIREERIALGQDDQPAREYFVRCAKALIQSGPTGGDVYATRLGYRLELIPEADPYTLKPGDNLTFTLLWKDKPAVGLLVKASRKEAPDEVQAVRVDADGHATIKLEQPGTWLVKAVSIRGIQGLPEADWLSHWASFVFELPAA